MSSEVFVNIVNRTCRFLSLSKIMLHTRVYQKITYAATNNNSQKQPNIIRHNYQHQKISNNELKYIQKGFLEVRSGFKSTKNRR